MGQPSLKDTFLRRICIALDETPRELAKSLKVPYSEICPLLSRRGDIAEIDNDEIWWKIHEYVSIKMGLLFAIKWELDKALQKDRKKRIMRHVKARKIYERNN